MTTKGSRNRGEVTERSKTEQDFYNAKDSPVREEAEQTEERFKRGGKTKKYARGGKAYDHKLRGTTADGPPPHKGGRAGQEKIKQNEPTGGRYSLMTTGSKHGGRIKRKRGGKADGHAAHHRADKPRRARGGGAPGANKAHNPFTMAAKLQGRPGFDDSGRETTKHGD